MSDAIHAVWDPMLEFMDVGNAYMWGPWTPFVLLTLGIIFTIWTRLTQYRALTHGVQVIRGHYDDPNDPGAINHFQALSAALSATIGLGNIGGVALAVSMGGPGAVFWMWVVGFFGMALKTVEITLSMQYRNTDDPNNPHGGAMWVVDKVLGSKGGALKALGKAVGVFFCITLIISTMTGGNMFQAWNVATVTKEFYRIPELVTGIILALLTGLVIVGGIKRIGNVAGRIVPFMCLLYIIGGLAVIAVNIEQIPGLLMLIVRDAFTASEAVGAFIGGAAGYGFMEGMKRGLFSNEAGQGSAPIAHAAAKTDEPAREGIVGGLGPFIDTIIVCTITALVILVTGTWNRPAIGPIGIDVQVVQDAADPNVWRIVPDAGVNAELDPATVLPLSRYNTWGNGAKFFVLAEVQGSDAEGQPIVRENTLTNRVKVIGGVDAKAPDPAAPEAPQSLVVRFNDLRLNPDDWSGPITGLQLMLVDRAAVPEEGIEARTAPGIYRDYEGAALTAHAFDREFQGVGTVLVTIAVWLFAFSTMISWSYYGEQGMIYMLGKWSVLPYKLVFLALVVIAAGFIKGDEQMVILMDFGLGAMLWANLPIVGCFGYLALRELRGYDRRLKRGEFVPHSAPPITDVVEGRE